MDEKDVSVREATIMAIESSQAGLKDIKDVFAKAASKFDSGDDQGGLSLIASDLIPKVKAFFGFTATLASSNPDVISKANADKLVDLFKRSDEVLKRLFKESGAKNYTEVGDILRFDFSDLISEYAVVLPKVAEDFKKSSKGSLDNR